LIDHGRKPTGTYFGLSKKNTHPVLKKAAHSEVIGKKGTVYIG